MREPNRRGTETRYQRSQRIKRERIRQRRITIIALVAGILFILVFGNLFRMYRTVSKEQGETFLQHIYIDGIDVSGMTHGEASSAVNAKIATARNKQMTLIAGDKKTIVKLSALGLESDSTKDLVNKAFAYGREGSLFSKYRQIKELKKNGKKEYYGTFTINQATARAYLQNNCVDEDARAKNATIIHKSGDEFVIKEGKKGITLDLDASLEKITSQVNQKWKIEDGKINLVTKEEKPSVKAKDLESIKDKLGTFTTIYSTALARAANIANGANKIDGIVLKPGESISVEDTLSPLTTENGYVEATAYSSGKVVPSIAGGICQVSTTLYNAVIRAELEVVERYPHSMLVEYADPADDAAISEGKKDFVFKNNQKTPILLECITGGGKITASIYGKETRDPNRTLSFKSEVISSTDPELKYDTSSDYALGSVQTTAHGAAGKTAKLWKIVMINGKETEREEVNTSNYAVSDRTITVGTKSDSAAAVRIIKNAVATQDKATIMAAIKKAKATAR